MLIAKGTVVAMHYRVATSEGEHVDASQPGQPLWYLHGTGQIISGLEDALAGKSAGDHVTAEVPAARAYGVRDPDLDLSVPRDAFPEDVRKVLAAGFQFQAGHPKRDGEVVLFTVHGLRGDDVLVSGNHPLVDKDLRFEVDIESVRLATPEETAHGHAHAPGMHHH
jgi:FKBP-type peptidyl-prolyl cis-trans isomerase SlyD